MKTWLCFLALGCFQHKNLCCSSFKSDHDTFRRASGITTLTVVPDTLQWSVHRRVLFFFFGGISKQNLWVLYLVALRNCMQSCFHVFVEQAVHQAEPTSLCSVFSIREQLLSWCCAEQQLWCLRSWSSKLLRHESKRCVVCAHVIAFLAAYNAKHHERLPQNARACSWKVFRTRVHKLNHSLQHADLSVWVSRELLWDQSGLRECFCFCQKQRQSSWTTPCNEMNKSGFQAASIASNRCTSRSFVVLPSCACTCCTCTPLYETFRSAVTTRPPRTGTVLKLPY